MKKTVDKEKLARYRNLLPYGSAKDVAAIAGRKVNSVSDYLNGKSRSPRIEFAILQVIKEHKEKLEAAQRAAGLL